MNRSILIPLLFFLSFLITASSGIRPHVDIKNLEIPACTGQTNVTHHCGYCLAFVPEHQQPMWVAYVLTKNETVKTCEREDRFTADPDVQLCKVCDLDYRGSGYDKGHLAPAADMGWSRQSMAESFYYSNVSPQVPGFNRGIWSRLEKQVRNWAVDYDSVYIVTGPVLREGLPKIGLNQVSVPDYFYKVILDYSPPEIKAIAFILPNKASKLSLTTYTVSIDSAENITGLDFFPQLPDDIEKVVEAECNTLEWKWSSQQSPISSF